MILINQKKRTVKMVQVETPIVLVGVVMVEIVVTMNVVEVVFEVDLI
jgi:hypothetical protein